jgi:hypothetical protein
MAIYKKLPVFVYQERIDPEYKHNYLFFHKRFLSYTRNVCLKLPHLTFNKYFFFKNCNYSTRIIFQKRGPFSPQQSNRNCAVPNGISGKCLNPGKQGTSPGDSVCARRVSPIHPESPKEQQ